MFQDWGHYLKMAAPIATVVSLVWISYEGFTIMTSYLDSVSMEC